MIEELIKSINRPIKLKKRELTTSDFVPRYRLVKFKEYLSPDSEPYFSTLNSVFSYELDYSSLKSEFFYHFNFRDGVMPLLRFFSLNLDEKKYDKLLIVDSSLKSLVPNNWRCNVFLRDLVFNKPTHHFEFGQKNNILICISPTMGSFDESILKDEIGKLLNKIEKKQKLYFFFSSAKMRGEGAAYHDQALNLKILNFFMKHLTGIDVSILSYKEILTMNLGDSSFVIINPLKMYFADSYLHHFLIQGGSTPLWDNIIMNKKDSYLHRISIFHSFYVHQDYEESPALDYQSFKNVVPEIEMSPELRLDYLYKNKFCSDELMSWSKDLAKDIYLRENFR